MEGICRERLSRLILGDILTFTIVPAVITRMGMILCHVEQMAPM